MEEKIRAKKENTKITNDIENKNIGKITMLITKGKKAKPMGRLQSNFAQRTVQTILMMCIFSLIISLDKIYVILIVYLIKTLCFREVIRVVDGNMKRKIVPATFLTWYFMITSDLFIIGKSFIKMYSNVLPRIILDHHTFVCFTLYVAGLVYFVLSLEKKMLKKQFGDFAISHLAIYIITLTCNFCINNIIKGKIWLVYPALLVVSNDIFAYIVGRSIGKTPLIKLSPKKTVEGFIGGFICTIAVGLFLCYLKVNYGLGKDDLDSVLFSQCTFNLFRTAFKIKTLYIHACAFILFSSLIAPFGGFFASGFKRAFRIKDFGESIPGHGGFCDRMDCQFLMAVFTSVYIRSFIIEKRVSFDKCLAIITNNLTPEEIVDLAAKLYSLYGNDNVDNSNI